MKDLQEEMFNQLKEKEIFEHAKNAAFEYIDNVNNQPVFPSNNALAGMDFFDEKMPTHSSSPELLLETLNKYGSPSTTAQTGGRYFGFVNGGAIPVALAAKWLSDIWDQNAGLFMTSPINSKLEGICESWLKEIFDLPESTVAGYVSGTSVANLTGLAAARFHLLKNLNWDINLKGLNGAPKLNIIAHRQVHAAIKKALTILGFGNENITWVDADNQGRIKTDKNLTIDSRTLIILQAGNANSGSFDPFEKICEQANKVDAWVHIDGAFGLWAAASKQLSYLTKGINKASSWAVDGHKTLNTPYDSGIILCKYPEALINAMQASGEYIIYSNQKDGMVYTPEMSRRSRAIELWATMKYLGKSGIEEMINRFHSHALKLAEELKTNGFRILN